MRTKPGFDFRKEERHLLNRITRHEKERKTKNPPTCTTAEPCWNCSKCVPSRYVH